MQKKSLIAGLIVSNIFCLAVLIGQIDFQNASAEDETPAKKGTKPMSQIEAKVQLGNSSI